MASAIAPWTWTYFIDMWGNYGYVLLFLLSFSLYRHIPLLLVYFSAIALLANLINHSIKGIVKQPRPFATSFSSKKLHSLAEKFGFEIYGMPSGHSMNVWFITIFYMFMRHSKTMTWQVMLFFSTILITMFQRFIFGHHTISQIIVGSLIGLCLGFLSANFYTNFLEQHKDVEETEGVDSKKKTVD